MYYAKQSSYLRGRLLVAFIIALILLSCANHAKEENNSSTKDTTTIAATNKSADKSIDDEGKGCGTFRNKKLSDALFQDVKILLLNCDSTFSYRRSNCVFPETFSGAWTLNGDTITLSLTNETKRLAKEKTEDGFRYTNLDRTMMTINDSIIFWKRSEKWIDTLYRQRPVP